MKPGEYLESLLRLIAHHPMIVAWDCSKDVRTAREGFLKARLTFIDGSWLEFREFVNCSESEPKKYAYAYHYQKGDELIFRYDNTPHHPQLESFPHHKHARTGLVLPCIEPNLTVVLEEIENTILREAQG